MGRISSFSLALLLLLTGPAMAAPGPPLTEPPEALRTSIECSADPKFTPRAPVLLVHGTGATVAENFQSNYKRFLVAAGYPWCSVQIPNRAVGDVQRNVQYVVYAIRVVAEHRGERIDVIGHNQGGLLPTFALKFWPDLQRKVDDFVSFAGVFDRGTTAAHIICATPPSCSPAFTQFTPGSAFLIGYASRPLPHGPSYTAFATAYDEVVTPAPDASHINDPRVRNYTLQDLCPADAAEHLSIVASAPFLALTLDALAHRGPAILQRVADLPCGFVPDAAVEMLFGLPTFAAGVAQETAAQSGPTEPAVHCHLDPACVKPRLRPRLKIRVGRRFVRGRLILPVGALDPCGGRVTVNGRTTRVRRSCRFRVRTRKRPVRVRFRGTAELRPVTVRR